MAELRQDVVSGRWVIIATERAARPHDFFVGRGEPRGGFCPFCEGNEDRPPPEVMAIREPGSEPNTRGWRVRVVPNKFPALQPALAPDRRGSRLYPAVGGHGTHEVIIETPHHAISPTELSPEQFRLVIETYSERARAIGRSEALSYVLIFKNVGEGAGASIEHAHSQLIAVPVMPRRVEEEMRACEQFYRQEGRCLICDILEAELQSGERIIAERDGFVALSTYAARFPFEFWILPRRHAGQFHQTAGRHVPALAGLLQETIARLEVVLQDPPFNYAVHTAPVDDRSLDYYHWHIEVIPRVTHVAGFEWGTGFYINPMEPEQAAEHMRAVSPEQIRQKMSLAPQHESQPTHLMSGEE